MKRTVAIVLTMTLLLGLSACTAPSDGTASSDQPETTYTDSDVSTTSSDAASDNSTTTTESGSDVADSSASDSAASSTSDNTANSETDGTTTTTKKQDTTTTKYNPDNGGKVTKPTTTTTRKPTTTTTTKRTTKVTEVGHKHSLKRTVTQPATCTEQGYTQVEYPCCGATEPKTDLKPALGHSYGAWHVTKAPTNASTGEETRSCQRCAHEEKRTVAKLPTTTDATKKAILDLVNAERRKAGVAELSYYVAEEAAADQRVKDIKTKFEHYRPDGQPFYSIMTGLGKDYFGCGENIAKGFSTPEEVMVAWMNSPRHKANILDPDFDALVVGVEDGYWVQLFISF